MSDSPGTFPFIELQSVDSTNKYAANLIHEGLAQHGQAVFSHEQTAGRGQLNKKWVGEGGKNIALSVIINPIQLKLEDLFLFNASVSLGVWRFFSQYAGEETRIKWPNDLYWRDRKAGGILIENTIGPVHPSGKNNWKWSVTGIGININQVDFDPLLPNPVSLKQITGKDFNLLELARILQKAVMDQFNLLAFQEAGAVLKAYNDILYKKNEKAWFKKDNRRFEATIRKVTAGGQLVIEHGVTEMIDFGDIEWLF